MRTIDFGRFIDLELGEKILESKEFLLSLHKKDLETIRKEYEKVLTLPVPYRVYIECNKMRDLEDIANEQNEIRKVFYTRYPYFTIYPVIDLFKRLLSAKNTIWKNEMRKFRESPKVINVLRNDKYLIMIYNKRIIGTQGYLAFIGLPLFLIEHREFSFLKRLLPTAISDIEVKKKVYPSASYGCDVWYYLDWDV